MIIYLVLGLALTWLAYVLIIPLILINSGALCLLTAFCSGQYIKLLYFLSVIGAGHVFMDYHYQWLPQALADDLGWPDGSH